MSAGQCQIIALPLHVCVCACACVCVCVCMCVYVCVYKTVNSVKVDLFKF